MLPTTIRSLPSVGDFTPLEEFQSQTPESFSGGKPILHFHLVGAKASAPKSQSNNLAIFSSNAPAAESHATNGDAEPVVEREVDLFVTSETFTLFSKDAEAGVSIPYPSISIHAVKQIGSEGDANRTQAVWMQLEFSDGGQDDDEFNTIDLTIVPPTTANPEAITSPVAPKLYEAIANCSNLHPDPRDEDDGEDGDGEDDPYDRIIFEGSAEHEAIEGFTGVLRGAADGSLPPPMPGSGGWITADNVHEYFDEDGNWIGQGADEDLGDGAGRTRGREELEDGDAEANGPDETKRPRVD